MTGPTPIVDRVKILGRGATSVVELGVLRSAYGDWPEGTEVAVKRLLPELSADKRALAALEEEAEALSEAEHPSLVRALFRGKDDHGSFLALEFVAGKNLDEVLAETGPLPEPRVRSVGEQLAGALAALHAAGRVHGDLKPENARLDDSGRAVLIDLGFSRRFERTNPDREGETLPGNLLFLSPETARGAAPTPGSDVFAIGILLYFLATGEHPFIDSEQRGADLESGATQLLKRLADLHRDGLQPPSAFVVELSPFFDQLIERVLSPYPASRPTAEELATLLENGETHPWWRERVARGESGRGATDHPRTHLTQLVGREDALDTLTLAHRSLKLASAEEPGSGAVVWCAAPAGSGKSRLVTEFAARMRTATRPPMYLYGRASERRESRPLGTLLSLLRRWLQLPPGANIGPRGVERLNRTVPPQDAEALALALGPGGGEFAPALPVAVVAWLSALAETRRLIIFIDDLHHAGGATLGALGELARELFTTEVLLVLGLRSDAKPASAEALQRLKIKLDEFAERTRAVPLFDLSLGPLTKAAVSELVAARFDPSVPRDRLALVLWERSLGSPGLISELLRGLEAREDAGSISPDNPLWQLDIEPESMPYPRSLKRAIADRMNELEPAERLWLGRLSVIGGRIAKSFVADAFPETPAGDLDRVLVALTAADWLTPVADRYRFSRPALREAIYNRLDITERREIHSRVADALATEDGDNNWEGIFYRAHHLKQADRSKALFELLRPLIPNIPKSGQPERVLTLAQWAIEACRPAPEISAAELMDLYEIAVDAANGLGRRDLERDLLDHMIDLDLNLEGDPKIAARVYLAHGRFSLGIGQMGLARGWLSNAIRFARSAESNELLCDGLRRLATLHAFSGDFESARSMVTEAVEIAPDSRRRAFASLASAQIAVIENRITDALKDVATARAELSDKDPDGLESAHAAVDMLRARISRSIGRHGRALASASRAVQRARRSGDRRLEVEATARLGGLEIDLGRFDSAAERLRDARSLAIEIEDKGGRALVEMWMAILSWERDAPEAGQVLERTIELAAEIGHHRLRALALAILARQRASVGELEAALKLGKQAAELLDRYGAELTDRIVIRGTLALVERLSGNESRARSVIRRIRRRIRSESRALDDERLRSSQQSYAERLLEATVTEEGPLYPPIRLDD